MGEGKKRESRWTYGLPSLPSTTPLGNVFFSGVAVSSESGVGSLFFFCMSLKNLSMAEQPPGRREEGGRKRERDSIECLLMDG